MSLLGLLDPEGGFNKDGYCYAGIHMSIKLRVIYKILHQKVHMLIMQRLHVGKPLFVQDPTRQDKVESAINAFAPFYNNTTFSDVVLKAQRIKIHAHKVVLAAHSRSLAAMLTVRISNQAKHIYHFSNLLWLFCCCSQGCKRLLLLKSL